MILKPARLPLTAVLLLAACKAGPNYVRPSAPITPTFKESVPGFQTATPLDGVDKGQWWTLFGDPELNALVDELQRNNQTIEQSLAAYRQAVGLLRQNRANLYPTIGTTASYTNSGVGASSNRAGGVALGGSGDAYRLQATGSWIIDLFGQVRRNIEGARASSQAAAADIANVRLAQTGQMVNAYLQLRSLDADAVALDASVAAFQRDLQITTNRYNAGIAAKTDVVQAQTQLLNAQVSARDNRRARGILEHSIAILVGRPPAALTIAQRQDWQPVTPVPPAGVPSTLLQRRPDIAAAERRVQAANAQIGVQSAAFFPQLTLSGNVGQTSSTIGDLFNAAANTYSLGPSLAQTVFSFGRRQALVAQARAQRDQTIATYRQTVLTAFADVEDNLLASRVFRDEVALSQQASRAADQAEVLVRNQYKAGQVDYSQVIVAQTTALNTRRSLITTAYNAQAAAVNLIVALGGGWDVRTADPVVAPSSGPTSARVQQVNGQ
jgi:NodT family efflux transporter outer membrane factor (OMF) lipoprotein